MPAVRMSAATWRFAVWRVMGHRGRCAPLGLVCARLRPWIQLDAWQGLGDRNGPPVASAALQGRDPDLARLEVDGDAGPGHREGVGEGLDGRLGVRADRGEEALALAGKPSSTR